MLKKDKLYYFTFLLGTIFIFFGFYLSQKGVAANYTGLAYGVGSGMLGLSLANIISHLLAKKNPEIEKRKNIEINDERNKFLHYKTCYTLYHFNIYMLALLTFISVALGLPLYFSALIVGIIILESILYFIIFYKYSK